MVVSDSSESLARLGSAESVREAAADCDVLELAFLSAFCVEFLEHPPTKIQRVVARRKVRLMSMFDGRRASRGNLTKARFGDVRAYPTYLRGVREQNSEGEPRFVFA
jgi:hypothetical protein